VKILQRKRLDRDRKSGSKWGFEQHPYYQMRVDIDEFHGLVCFIQLIGGRYCYWDLPKAGKTAVCGRGMTWLQLIPDGKNYVLTTKYLPKKFFRKNQKISIWYADIIENIEYDTDGVAVFIDKYLDVYFTPQGDIKIDDRDELDEAYKSGELSQSQYDSALKECDLIIGELCSDIVKTEILCNKILSYVNDKIKLGEKQFKDKIRI
jgi:predicted RNA-binding protein associated with RNAse of E/G family